MNAAALRSSGSTRAGSVQGLFSVCTGGMVGAGAARSGRRTPEPHVWPAAPLQFMRGDGWRGAAMEEATGKWVGLTDALREIASAQLWDQCRVAWEACQSKGGYAALARAFEKAYFAYNARVHGSTSPARNMRPPVRPPELNGMDAAVSLLQGEIVTFLCSGVERVRFYRMRQGDYQTPPNESWRRCAFQHSDSRRESSSFEDFFRSYWVQCGTPDWIPVECIQIFRAEETAASEPAVSSVKKPGGPGRPEKAETTFARILVRAWLEEEGEDLSERGKQSDCLKHVMSALIAKYENDEIPSESTVKKLIKEESEKLKAEKEKARESARN